MLFKIARSGKLAGKQWLLKWSRKSRKYGIALTQIPRRGCSRRRDNELLVGDGVACSKLELGGTNAKMPCLPSLALTGDGLIHPHEQQPKVIMCAKLLKLYSEI